ncbi:DNA methyltransferase [Thermodesulfobacteriota bacterium]
MNNSITKKINLIDWDCTDSDTRYLTHPIHRYSGKFIPQIATQVIELVTNPGDLVLDPYCGSGTTLLECQLYNRRSIGIDLNPLAVLISKVKTNVIDVDKLISFQSDIKKQLEPLEYLEEKSQNDQFGLFQSFSDSELRQLSVKIISDWRWNDEWYVKWFRKERLTELIAIYHVISNETNINFRNIGLLAFSDILRISSNAHGSYPNVMFDKKKKLPKPALPRFLKRLKEIIDNISQLEGQIVPESFSYVCRSDASELPIPNNIIDAIITHPPYIASIPYAEYGLLSLAWLGYNPRDLDKQLTGGRRQSKYVVNKFNEGFKKMFYESYRVLKKNGTLFMLLGNPTVKGEKVDLAQMAKVISKSLGFSLIAQHYRNGVNKRANLMSKESLLFFKK